MADNISFFISLLYLSVCTYTDIRQRKINLFVSIAFALIGIITVFIFNAPPSPKLIAIGLIPGLLLSLLSLMTRGSIGLGDGLMLISLGCIYTGPACAAILFYALIISSLYSLFMLTIRKKDKKHTFAFAPFLLSADILYWVLL